MIDTFRNTTPVEKIEMKQEPKIEMKQEPITVSDTGKVTLSIISF